MNAEGFYISSYNRSLSGRLADWSLVHAGYVHIRVLDGLQPDPDAAHNVAGAQAAGIPWSAVQSFYPWLDVHQQATLLGGYKDQAPLGLAADFESADRWSAISYRASADRYRLLVQAISNAPLLVYTNEWFGSTFLPAAWGKSNPLWIANPGSSDPHLPLQWSAWRFWQDSCTWSTPGIFDPTICHDCFNGTSGDLAALYHLVKVSDPLVEWRRALTAWARGQGYSGPDAP